MRTFKDFVSYNKYIGLAQPLDNNIDAGYYDAPNMLLKSDPIMVDFYRISIKINFIDKSNPNAAPINAVFFNSPELATGWDADPSYTGMYVQLSKKIIDENRFLFKNYLDYGQHEALYLTPDEVEEISTVFALMIKYYNSEKKNFSVLLSYVNVLTSLVEAFYKRQFSTNPKQYNRIIADFQQGLKEYYQQPVSQPASVQYFAEKLGLTSNYLGDIVKYYTQRSAMETIHDFVITKAKEMLETQSAMNSTEIAYELGFEYPNNFAQFFKKNVGFTPKQYREHSISSQA